MSIRILAYRVYRLRRLIVFCTLLPLATIGVIWLIKGPAAAVLLPLALLPPIVHVLRYPTAWMESLAVSVVSAALLALAGTIGDAVGLLGLALRILGLSLLGLVLFFILVGRIAEWVGGGEARPHTARTRSRSFLPPDQLKARITLYPGRNDARVTCSPADEDGAFSVTIHQSQPSLVEEGAQPFEIEMFAQVLESTDSTHEVMCVEAPPEIDLDDESLDPEMRDVLAEVQAELHHSTEDVPPAVAVSRHLFQPTRSGGTRVEVAETGAVMTRGMALGFWLQDYYADHLTDEIDLAEGREPKANRSTDQAQLLVDLARLFLRSGTPAHPAE